MGDGPVGNAMTEVGLALAMGFFCLLVLALVSMGMPAPDASAYRRVEVLAASAGGAAGGAAMEMAPSDRLVVLHGGRFMDADRRPLDPATLVGGGRVVLAVDPALPMAEILEAHRRLGGADLLVTPLDPAWLAALAAGGGQ